MADVSSIGIPDIRVFGNFGESRPVGNFRSAPFVMIRVVGVIATGRSTFMIDRRKGGLGELRESRMTTTGSARGFRNANRDVFTGWGGLGKRTTPKSITSHRVLAHATAASCRYLQGSMSGLSGVIVPPELPPRGRLILPCEQVQGGTA